MAKFGIMKTALQSALLTFLFCLLSGTMAAQFSCNYIAYSASPNFTSGGQYMFMQSHYNPGYVGWKNQPTWWVSGKLNSETSLGVRGNGNQFNVNWQGQFPEWKSNLGVVFNYEQFNDNRGENSAGNNADRYDFKQWKLGLQHNFMFDIGDGKAQAGFGVALLKYADIFTGNQGGLVNEYKYRPNVDVGLLASWGNFEIGAAVLHSNEPAFRGNQAAGGVDRNAQFRRVSYIQTSYEFLVGEKFYIKPNFLMRQLIGQGSTNSCGVSMDIGVLFNLNDSVFASYSWGYHKQNYPHSVMVAYRTLGGYQISASMDFSSTTGRDRSRFEIGFGLYLFGEYYDDEEDETPELR